jgi:signal transduction histidine kinase
MENALLEQETKVREEMVRNLSLEVRTPLAIISTNARLCELNSHNLAIITRKVTIQKPFAFFVLPQIIMRSQSR